MYDKPYYTDKRSGMRVRSVGILLLTKPPLSTRTLLAVLLGALLVLPLLIHALPTRFKPWIAVRDSLTSKLAEALFAVTFSFTFYVPTCLSILLCTLVIKNHFARRARKDGDK